MDVDLVISPSRCCLRQPARLNDRLLIGVTCAAVGDSDLTASFELRTEDHVVATAAITYVTVRGGRRCSLPDQLLK